MLDIDKILKKEKELKKHPQKRKVQIVDMADKESYDTIMKNGGSYDIKNGIRSIKKRIPKKSVS